MNISLRTRLSLLVVAALCCTVGPILLITYRNVSETALRMEQKAFSDLLVIEEESINAGYMNLLATKVSSVQERKRRLQNAAMLALSLLRDARALGVASPEERETPGAGIMERLSTDGLRLDRFNAATLMSGGVNRLGLTPDVRDAKGRTLTSLLRNLPRDGDFAVFNLPLSVRVAGSTFALVPSVTQPVLAYFLPAADNASPHLRADGEAADDPPGFPPHAAEAAIPEVLVALTPLRDLEEAAAASEQAIIRATQEKFSTLSVYDHGFIALLDGNGQALAFSGTHPVPEQARLAPYLKEARQHSRAEARLPSTDNNRYGDMLYLFAYTPAFDWHVVIAAPLAEISAPSTHLLTRLVAFSGAAMLAALIVTLFMLARAIRPLHVLTRKVQDLPSLDFSAPETEQLVARDLPLARGDEVGQLARAFARMGRQLSANIRALMEATASKERMEGELNAAREIQIGILPPPDGAPNIFGFTASAFLDPAKEVGGDLYDFFTTPDGRNALVLGDVSGKGVPAALFMSMTVTLVRYALSGGLDPAEAMGRINALLAEHNPGNMFVTLFLALYDSETGDLEYANGGHCPPYVANAASDAPVRILEHLSGPLVGVMPDMEYDLFHDRLAEGELCLLFTDGVTEAMNEAEELYGEERLMDFLNRRRADGPKELLGNVFADVVRYRGAAAPSDDITMLAFARR